MTRLTSHHDQEIFVSVFFVDSHVCVYTEYAIRIYNQASDERVCLRLRHNNDVARCCLAKCRTYFIRHHTLRLVQRIRIYAAQQPSHESVRHSAHKRRLLCIQFAYVLHDPVTFHLFQMPSLCIRKEINSIETIRGHEQPMRFRYRWRFFHSR